MHTANSFAYWLINAVVWHVAAPAPPNRPPPVKPPPPPLGAASLQLATTAVPPANSYPARQPRPVPKQAESFAFELGGWFDGTPADDLLEGWWCEWNTTANRIVFVRLGRERVHEEFWCHPRILGTCEAIAQSTGSDLYQPSYPIHEGRWHGERDRLLYLQGQLLTRKDLAAWAYYEAGIELELYRTEAGFRFSWLYPDGDERPNWMRLQDLERPPVPRSYLQK